MTEAVPDILPRKRGRPPGSTPHKKRDARILARAADSILADPSLSNRAALNRAVRNERGRPDANALRRVQMKMKAMGRPAALAAATERREAERQRNEEVMRGLLACAEFMNGGPNFQRFVAKPEVQDSIRNAVTVARGVTTLLLPLAQAAQQFAVVTAPHLANGRKAMLLIESKRLP